MRTTIPLTLARLAVIIAVLAVFVPAANAIEGRNDDDAERARAQPEPRSTPALYNGRIIDISKDWEGAQTCVVAPDNLMVAECFDTDAQRDVRLEALGLAHLFEDQRAPDGAGFAFASCSSYLRLYNGTYYSGSSLWLSGRGYWMNMANYGFNQKASSYKVGGCSSYMADYANGGGGWISTSRTQAWDVDAVISGSWNNDISSVYII